MRDGRTARQLTFGTFLIDMNPLFVAGGIGKPVDALLGYLDPVADPDLAADGGFDLVEAVEYPHRIHLVARFA
jgi:hypothetical protein